MANTLVTVFAVIGSVASIYTGWLVVAERFGFYTWVGVQYRSKKLIAMIQKSGFKPDLVIGVGRSGAILGGILAGNLGVVQLAVIDRQYDWDAQGKKRSIRVINTVKPSCIAGRNILLVDAAPNTGATCEKIEVAIKAAKPACIKVAALYRTKVMSRSPDFYVTTESTPRKMPWRFSGNYVEDFTRPDVLRDAV